MQVASRYVTGANTRFNPPHARSFEEIPNRFEDGHEPTASTGLNRKKHKNPIQEKATPSRTFDLSHSDALTLLPLSAAADDASSAPPLLVVECNAPNDASSAPPLHLLYW